MPYLGNEPAVAYTSTTKDTFSGDGSTTDFTMSKSANVNAVRVVVENVVQNPTVAYTCSGTTIAFTSAPPTGTSNIYVVHLGPPAATVAPPTTINNATTFTSNVTLKSEVAEDTDGGRGRGIDFQGTQSGGEISKLAQILAAHDGTADDEKGDLIFKTNDGSDGASPTEALRIDSEQNLGLGTNSPDVRLHVTDSQEQLTLSEGGSKGATFDYRSSTGFLQIATNGIDARANPQMTLDLNGQLRVGRADDAVMNNALTVDAGNNFKVLGLERSSGVTTGTGEFAIHMETNSQTTICYDDEGSVVFGTAGTPSTAAGFTERIRISATGELFIGKTGEVSTQDGFQFKQTGECLIGRGSNDTIFVFQDTNSSGATVGSISITSSNTAYNTSSDYRLKENITDVSDGITRVKQLQPRRFNFIVNPDTEIVDGFIAHEVSDIVPEAITGEKDAVKEESYQVTPAELDDDGRIVKEAVMGTRTVPDHQGIDQSKLVPLLTAALQEAIAKIETLETKVAALEAG